MYNQLAQDLIQDVNIQNYVPHLSTVDKYLVYMRKKYRFGDSLLASEKENENRKIIFDIAIRPLLEYSLKNLDLDLYSKLDHYLFQSYICSIEDLDWFSKSFWDVNSYGLAIARVLSRKYSNKIENINSSSEKILFVFKGPYMLAHSNVLNDFLSGINKLNHKPQVHLLLLDAKVFLMPGIKVLSLSDVESTSAKVMSFIKYCMIQRFSNIIWVSCIQNLALYMGLGMSKKQTYWTMKRHSIVFPEITKYATFISQYRNQKYNNVFWYGGRYRLKAAPTLNSRSLILNSINSQARELVLNNFVFGSLARSQKYQSLQYWEGIELLLLNSAESIYIYGANDLPIYVKQYIHNSDLLKNRTINFGWLNGKTADIASLIQIYIDTIPFGSGLTAAECVLSGGCYLGTLSEINKEASFTNVLTDAINLSTHNSLPYNKSEPSCGIFSSFGEALNFAIILRGKPEKIIQLNKLQKKILTNLDSTGQKYFTSDYLEFFNGTVESH